MIYYYLKNVQGDIIGITNSNNQLIVKYEYDAFGNIISIKDINNQSIVDPNHIGLLNPFRYRGYYYDAETELYYLNSRYYNPKWGRYLNADCSISPNGDFQSYNLFTYCSNNPVSNKDTSGATGNNSAVVLQCLGMASNYDINVIIEYDNYVLSE